jgi:LPS-assembly protein
LHEVVVRAVGKQEVVGHDYHFRDNVIIETTEMRLQADELDYNDQTGDVEARGHVIFEHFTRGEKLRCDKADYNVNDETGKFYNVSGSAPSRIEARPGLLTTQNPFYFEGRWAERLTDRYVLHDGFLTDCIVPRPWWRLKGPVFDVIPGEHAIAKNPVFYLRGFPLFYTPYFYKSLEKQPRKSGLLASHIVPSSRHGFMVSSGYYWAIGRSYDVTYEGEMYVERGLASHFDFRGRPNDRTSFDVNIFGLKDGTLNGQFSPGGVQLSMHGETFLGHGWEARGDIDYLSSFAFRLEWSQSFHEAVNSETHSVGVLTKHWDSYAVNVVAERDENFQSTNEGDAITLRKLPEVEFLTRDRAIRNLPFYVSLDTSSGLERRSQPLFQTRQFVERLDFAPRINLPIHFWGLNVLGSFGIRETFYDSSIQNGAVTGDNVLRNAQDVNIDIALPSIARIFEAPGWLGLGKEGKIKHIIEPRIMYRYVTGINDFSKLVRFDETELMSNTNEVEFSLTNRLMGKTKDGNPTDLLTWQLWYKRYFDPTFGGALIPGQRNVLETSADLTAYSFLSEYRHQSPIVSALRLQSRIGFEWRTDYDPVYHQFTNSGITLDYRKNKYAFTLGNNVVRADPALAQSLYPQNGQDQIRGSITYGNDNRRGWNYGVAAYYDIRKGFLQYSQTQITYNTDCCGFSVQYRRFALGARNENQLRIAFAISNIGSFGTLKRQEKIF